MTNENGITCQEFVELVTDYLEHVLLPEMHKQFEEHTANCPGCETYFEQIRKTISMLNQIAEEPVSRETRQKQLQAFGQWKQEHNQNSS
jgi:predicted anti-sigma-YlaC factor YlaD